MNIKILSILYILIAIINSNHLFAQQANFEWAKQMGSPYTDNGQSITVDAHGNVYTVGYFYGIVDFDPGTSVYNLSANGSTDTFIQKLDSNGNFLWAKNIEGSDQNHGNSIVLDISGNIYITGYFEETADFDPGINVYNLTSAGDKDVFILKLDTNGDFIWAKQMGGAHLDSGHSITLDQSGNIYTTGWFSGTANLDTQSGGNTQLVSAGLTDIFVVKLNSDGDFLWANAIGGVENDYGYSIAVDMSNNAYITGMFHSTVDFDPGNGNFSLTSLGSTDIFVQKSDTDGNFIWAKQMGGINSSYGYALTVDNAGSVYTTGTIQGPVDFDPSTNVYTLTSVGINDIFIQKMDTDGNFVWAKQLGQIGHDFGRSITLNTFGNIFITGRFSGTVDFNPSNDVTNNLTAVGSIDVFILKLDNNGNYLWSTSIGGSQFDSGNAIAVKSNYIYTTGSFRQTADFNPGTQEFNLTSVNESDIFIQKLHQCSTLPMPNISVLPDLIFSCNSATPTPPLAHNECGDTIEATTTTLFPITDPTITQIVWNYDDDNGNIITQNQNIIWTTSMDVTTVLNGTTLTANNVNGFYKWLNCDENYTPIFGENNQSYSPSVNGMYAVEITENGCVDTSMCVSVNTVGIDGVKNNIQTALYPNPSSGIYHILLTESIEYFELAVHNIQGEIIFSKIYANTSQTSINLKEASPGVYFLTIKSNNGKNVVKLIKE